MSMDEANSGNALGAGAPPAPPASDDAPCETLVKMLEQMLTQAKSGKLKGAVVLMVQGTGTMGPIMAPTDKWMLEYYACAGMLRYTIEGMWTQQIAQHMQAAAGQAQQFRRGLVPAPANALDGLPKDFFKKGQ